MTTREAGGWNGHAGSPVTGFIVMMVRPMLPRSGRRLHRMRRDAREEGASVDDTFANAEARRERVQGSETPLQALDDGRVGEIGLRDEDSIGDGGLFHRFRVRVERPLPEGRVHGRHDRG